mmetsp:Transcript_8867/g.21538  ORF Transcript_8867/g.21538 Transcript_8867/m.21538 type:complete len:102 (-) Transcript_8867:108-413(-)
MTKTATASSCGLGFRRDVRSITTSALLTVADEEEGIVGEGEGEVAREDRRSEETVIASSGSGKHGHHYYRRRVARARVLYVGRERESAQRGDRNGDAVVRE